MKELTTLCLAALLLVSCDKKANVKGDVLYKQNDRIGYKPDVNSAVYLFSEKGESLYQETRADIEGKFQFNNIPFGDYLLIVVSENVTDAFDEKILMLLNNKRNLKKYLKVDLPQKFLDEAILIQKNDSIILSMLTQFSEGKLSSKEFSQKYKEAKLLNIKNGSKILTENPLHLGLKLSGKAIVNKMTFNIIKVDNADFSIKPINFEVTTY